MSRPDMAQLASKLLEVLDAPQRAKLRRPFPDDAERRTWFYWPSPREGLPLAEVSHVQAMTVHKLVASVLSLHTFGQVTAIVALEHVLDEIEGGSGFRDPASYFLTVFGDPASEEWAWRFEGHHVSIHVTVSGEAASATPLFLGANPAAVRYRDHVVLRPLGAEEDAARTLLESLDSGQRDTAVVSDEAPPDLLTSNDPRVDPSVLAGGVPASELEGGQRSLLADLVRVYTDRLAEGLLEPPEVDGLSFAWAGSAEPGRPHYYRVWGPGFLAEYDNTQNDANHVHAVLRDPRGDFGEDILRSHLRRDHS